MKIPNLKKLEEILALAISKAKKEGIDVDSPAFQNKIKDLKSKI